MILLIFRFLKKWCHVWNIIICRIFLFHYEYEKGFSWTTCRGTANGAFLIQQRLDGNPWIWPRWRSTCRILTAKSAAEAGFGHGKIINIQGWNVSIDTFLSYSFSFVSLFSWMFCLKWKKNKFSFFRVFWIVMRGGGVKPPSQQYFVNRRNFKDVGK